MQLWWCPLDDALFDVATTWLSAAEQQRAARFGTQALARRYAIGRASLRAVLGRMLSLAPAEVSIERGQRGRPHVATGTGPDFNVSHTRDVALVGVCSRRGIRLGVDLEHAERQLDHVGLARKFLTPDEQARLAHLDDDARRRAFLRAWTCKEAMSKATGDALSAPLRKLDVRLDPDLRLLAGPAPYRPADWVLAAAAVPAPYIATVALWGSAGA